MAQNREPWGLRWRSSKSFIIGVVDFSVFSDVLLYGALVLWALSTV